MKWVPVSYCQFLIENNCTNAGKLFVYLKYESDGITGRDLIRKARNYFDVSDRTVRRWLTDAKAYNWIGFNPETGIYFVRSWQYLFDTLHFPVKSCFRFRKKDLKNFKTFCYAGVMSYMARVQIGKLERKSRRSIQAPIWIPLASSAIANTLNVSQRTAQTYRQKAVDAGYIQKRENLKPFHIKVTEIGQFRKYSPFDDKHLIVKDGKVYEQLPDEIKYNLNMIHLVRRFKKRIQQGTGNNMYAKSVRRL